MPELAHILTSLAALFAGGAAASGWTVAVIVANTAFDGLDHGRADRHLRQVLTGAAGFQSALLAIAAGLAIVTGAVGTFVTALVAALGFLSNMWTLSPRRDKAAPGVRKRESTRRVVAVALTLMFTLVAMAAGALAAFAI